MYNISSTISGWYAKSLENVPERYKILIVLLFFTIVIAIYAIVVWKVYKFLAKRDILELNLLKYNKISHAVLSKFYASLLFILEYIIITPLFVTFWFCFLSLFLIVLSKGIGVSQILLISASIIAATRLCSYFEEELSTELAKLFPLTSLAIVLLEPNILSLNLLIGRFLQLPYLFGEIMIFVGFIIALEILLRFGFTLIDFWQSEEDEKPKEIPKGAFPKPNIEKIK